MKYIRHILNILLMGACLLSAQNRDHAENKIRGNAGHFLARESVLLVRPAQTRIDARYYRLNLRVQYDPNRIYGKVTGRYTSRVDNLRLLALDLDEAMKIDSIAGPVSGFSHSGTNLDITLDRAFNQNEQIEVTVYYHGLPTSGDLVFDLMDGSLPHLWTLSEPFGAKFWWPCKDTPADKADSVDINITVPGGQLAASNGVLRAQTDNDDGTSTFYWHEKYPITTYLVSLAIGPYAHRQDTYHDIGGTNMLLDFYVYPSRAGVIPYLISETQLQLKTLSALYGPYPFLDEKYGLAQFGWGGGMEHQTLTSVGPVTNSSRYLYVHELGHQWFGDAITCASWSDIWLNEGFATYTEALYAEKVGYNGNEPGRHSLHDYMATKLYFDGGTITVADTSRISNIFARIVYNKAGWVLHMLRHVMGDDAFFSALKAYMTGPLRYTSVRTADFKNVCEDVSGKNLDAFFEQWLNRPFYPQYTYNWFIDKSVSTPPGKVAVTVNIEQNQTQGVYEMPIDIGFSFPDWNDTSVVLQNNQKSQSFTVLLNARPDKVIFDPDSWILKEVQQSASGTYHDDVTIETPFPNPVFNRTNIYVSSWDLQDVTLTIFDISGRLIRRLEAVRIASGHNYLFQWDRKNNNGVRVAAGIYFIRAARGAVLSQTTRRIIVLN